MRFVCVRCIDGCRRYMVADGAAMADQYGRKKELCTAMAKAPKHATEDELVANYGKFLTS